jgi:hypothetical protein
MSVPSTKLPTATIKGSYEREADVKIMFTKWCRIARPTISGMKIMQTAEICSVIHRNGG